MIQSIRACCLKYFTDVLFHILPVFTGIKRTELIETFPAERNSITSEGNIRTVLTGTVPSAADNNTNPEMMFFCMKNK